jgi:outer membrane protein
MKTLTATLLSGLLLAGGAAAQDLKIGFINTERIYNEAAPSIAIQKKLESEFADRRTALKRMADRAKELEKILSRGANLSDSQRKQDERELAALERDYQAKLREFSEDFNQRRNEEFAAVQERANRVVKEIAVREQYDLIVQDAVYVNPRIDLTPKVLKELEK